MKMMCVMARTVALKVAVVVAAVLRVTVQVDVPVHAPDQPANTIPVPGVAVRVTVPPVLKFAVQVCPQFIPAGALVTVPDPPPANATVSCACKGNGLPVTPTQPQENRIPTTAAMPANHLAKTNIVRVEAPFELPFRWFRLVEGCSYDAGQS